MSIQNELDKIKNAVYGKEVRGAIHDGIKRAYDDASEKDNANMEVKMARGYSPSLSDRLNSMQNENKDLNFNMHENKKEMTNKLLRKRDRSEPIGLNDASQDLLNAIAGGEGTNFTIESIPRDLSVAPHKTTFFDYEETRNIFSEDWEVGEINKLGVNEEREDMCRTGYTEIKPTTEYTFSFDGIDSSGITIYATTYDINKNFLGRFARSNGRHLVFVSESSAKYVRFHLFEYAGTFPIKTQLEKGSKPTTYVPHLKPFLKQDVLRREPTDLSETNFSKVGKNIFNGEWEDGRISREGTELAVSNGRRTGFLDIEPKEAYSMILNWDYERDEIPHLYIYQYDKDKVFLKLNGFSFSRTVTFNSLANTRYIRVGTFKDVSSPDGLSPTSAQLEKSVRPTIYEPPRLVLDNDYIYKEKLAREMGDYTKEVIQHQNEHVKAIAHRGYNHYAPENTYHAYVLAKKKGFKYVETDIQWTKDEVPVLFHDVTLDNHSNGTGRIKDHTLAELKSLDFGGWFNPKFNNTKILTYKEFLLLCKKMNLKPYLDLKDTLSQERADYMVSEAKKISMLRAITWCGTFLSLDNIRLFDEKARICTVSSAAPTNLDGWTSRITEEGNVFILIDYKAVTQELSDLCAINGIGLEVWIVNNPEDIKRLVEMNIQGIETDVLNIPKLINDSFNIPEINF